jgi:hypothetical protein
LEDEHEVQGPETIADEVGGEDSEEGDVENMVWDDEVEGEKAGLKRD